MHYYIQTCVSACPSAWLGGGGGGLEVEIAAAEDAAAAVAAATDTSDANDGRPLTAN